MEVTCSSETSVLTKPTLVHATEYATLNLETVWARTYSTSGDIYVPNAGLEN
jgi:hypothetical protein